MLKGELTSKALIETFKDSVIEVVTFRDETQILVKNEDLFKIMKFLKEDSNLAYNCLVNLTAVDRSNLETPAHNKRFEAVYHLHSYKTNDRVSIKTPVEESNPSVASVTPLWKTANWQEREVYDLYGIRFDGHPDLRRILLWDGYNGHPLRKDYPLKGNGERERFNDGYHDNLSGLYKQ